MVRTRAAKSTAPVDAPGPDPARSKPLVFISHDTRDAALAEAFDNLLTDSSGGNLKSFRASDKKAKAGIEFGTDWFSEIMGRLDEATDVVALLTANSIDRPWILFEVGVAKGKLDTVVFGVALGVPLRAANIGPFAQFQNSSDDEDSLTKLVLELMDRNLPDANPREEAIRRGVQAFRETLQTALPANTSESTEGQEGDDVAKLFEEVKAQLRELSEQVQRQPRTGGPVSRRFDFRLAERLLDLAASGPDQPTRLTAWLSLVGATRDLAPWMHEPGLDLYRTILGGSPAEIAAAGDRLVMLARAAGSSGLAEHRPMDRYMYLFSREYPQMLVHYTPQFVSRALSDIAEGPAAAVVGHGTRRSPGSKQT